MMKTNLSHLIQTHYPECNCMERYLDYGSLGYYIGQHFDLDELSELPRTVLANFEREMLEYEKSPISFDTHKENAFAFLDQQRNFFNGHFGSLCMESTLIRDQLKSIVSLSNAKYLVITTDSEPLGHMDTESENASRTDLESLEGKERERERERERESEQQHPDFIQKPYLGVEVLCKTYEDMKVFVDRLNDIMIASRVHLVTNASHDITQSFDIPVFYVSFMFAATTPEFERTQSKSHEISMWKQSFEHMKYQWWNDVYDIIKKCVN